MSLLSYTFPQRDPTTDIDDDSLNAGDLEIQIYNLYCGVIAARGDLRIHGIHNHSSDGAAVPCKNMNLMLGADIPDL